MRLLVTGGSGFIGGHFVELALKSGHEVVDIDLLTYAADPTLHAKSGRYRRLKLDIAGLPVKTVAFELGKVDAVVHLAAESHVDNSIEGGAERFLQVNILGTYRVLELARELSAKFIYMSTDEVYGDLASKYDPPFTEDSPVNPSSPYSASKASAELLILAWRRTYGLEAKIIRSTNVFGPRQHPEKFIPRAITKILSGQPALLYGQGAQIRDWMRVEDLADGILRVVEHTGPAKIFCLGARNERSNAEVIETIATVLDGKIEKVPDRPGHDFRYAIDPTLAEVAIPWRSDNDFAKHLGLTIWWYRNNEAWWKAAIKRGGRWK